MVSSAQEHSKGVRSKGNSLLLRVVVNCNSVNAWGDHSTCGNVDVDVLYRLLICALPARSDLLHGGLEVHIEGSVVSGSGTAGVELDYLAVRGLHPEVEIVAVPPDKRDTEGDLSRISTFVPRDSGDDGVLDLGPGAGGGGRILGDVSGDCSTLDKAGESSTPIAGVVSDSSPDTDARAPGAVGLGSIPVGPGNGACAGLGGGGLVAASEDTRGKGGWDILAGDLGAYSALGIE